MKLLELTAIPHPDINGGKPYPVYVNPDHIVMIELSKTSQERYGWREQQHDLAVRFWEEVQRCDSDMTASAPKQMVPDSEEAMTKINDVLVQWTSRRDIASSIHAAYGLIAGHRDEPKYYPPVECTCIQLAVPNARFTMLPAVYVTETPKEVAKFIARKSLSERGASIPW